MKMKKAFLVSLVIAVVVLSSFLYFPAPAEAQKGGQVVFALIDPLSGPFKDVGMEGLWHLEHAVDQINAKGGLLGKPVKLMKYDNQMKPDIALRMAKKAILEDGAKVIFQQSSSAIALALSKLAKEHNVIHVILHSEADEITGSEFQPNTFRMGLSTSMHSAILAQYFSQSNYKRYYLINQDYAFGHAVSDSFKKIFQKVKKPDMVIVGEDFHPMATKDFGPYVTKALAAKPDVIITGNFGPDLTGLVKQARALGLKAVIGTYYLDNPTQLNQIKESSMGTLVGEMYLSTVKTKGNQEYAKAWQAWFKKHYPGEPATYGVPSTASILANAGFFVAEAIRKAGTADAPKLISTLEGMVFDSYVGKQTMRACDHQLQTDGFVASVKQDHPYKSVLNFPYLGEATVIPVDRISVAPKETGNPRCK
jgi:branched-chain amino acid transport system substrate-binding protein